MKITIRVSVAETGNGKGRNRSHDAQQEFMLPGGLPWNVGSLATEMLRGAIDAYEQRSLTDRQEPTLMPMVLLQQVPQDLSDQESLSLEEDEKNW